MKLEKLGEMFLLIAILIQLLMGLYLFYQAEDSIIIFLYFTSSAILISVYMSEYKK